MSTHPHPTPPAGWEPQPEQPKDRRARKVVIGLAAGLVFVLASAVVIGQTSSAKPEPTAQTTEQTSPDTTLPPDFSDDELGVSDEAIPEDESDIAPEQGSVGSTAVISEDDGTGAVEVGEITVEKIEASKSWHGEYDTEYPENKWFIKVKVAAKGSRNGFDISPSDFFIRDPSDGSRYEYADGNAICVDAEPSFDSVTLTKDEKQTGYTVFDVPAKHGVHAYSPNWGGESVFEWEF